MDGPRCRCTGADDVVSWPLASWLHFLGGARLRRSRSFDLATCGASFSSSSPAALLFDFVCLPRVFVYFCCFFVPHRGRRFCVCSACSAPCALSFLLILPGCSALALVCFVVANRLRLGEASFGIRRPYHNVQPSDQGRQGYRLSSDGIGPLKRRVLKFRSSGEGKVFPARGGFLQG